VSAVADTHARPTTMSRFLRITASGNKDHKITCSSCLLCAGNSRKGANVTVLAHGSSDKVRAIGRMIQKTGKTRDSRDRTQVDTASTHIRSSYSPKEARRVRG